MSSSAAHVPILHFINSSDPEPERTKQWQLRPAETIYLKMVNPDLAREQPALQHVCHHNTSYYLIKSCLLCPSMCFNESLMNVAGATGLHTQFASHA